MVRILISNFYVIIGLCITKSSANANDRRLFDATAQMSIYPYNDYVMQNTLANICASSNCGQNVLSFDCQGSKMNVITVDRWLGSSGNELIGFHLGQSTYARLTEKPTAMRECTYRLVDRTQFRGGVLHGFLNTGSKTLLEEKTRNKPTATRIGNRDSMVRLRGQSMFLSTCLSFKSILKSLRNGNKKDYCFFI